MSLQTLMAACLRFWNSSPVLFFNIHGLFVREMQRDHVISGSSSLFLFPSWWGREERIQCDKQWELTIWSNPRLQMREKGEDDWVVDKMQGLLGDMQGEWWWMWVEWGTMERWIKSSGMCDCLGIACRLSTLHVILCYVGVWAFTQYMHVSHTHAYSTYRIYNNALEYQRVCTCVSYFSIFITPALFSRWFLFSLPSSYIHLMNTNHSWLHIQV